MRIYSHPACLLHSAGEGHPESPARLAAVLDGLRSAGLRGVEWCEAPAATRAQLRLAHSSAHIARVLDTPLQGQHMLDEDTCMNEHSAEAALRAAGAACDAVDAVVLGTCERAFCAIRPPGHHATKDRAMGFCLFNSAAIAAYYAIERHFLERVAIVDFDVHHGNGTQACVEEEARIMYLSTHERGIYPHTGLQWERGVGNVHNVPLPHGTDSERFRTAWRQVLLPELDDFRPQLLLISAGFDAHRADPLADMRLEADDFSWITRELVAIAMRHGRGRVVSLLEGGYDLAALRESVLAHVRELAE
ncbi:histone deacetylase family protein [Xanthomonadaceae bacterium JHOS43]|nr:histone deacetylase family protein [Xanthomonadaceae bacterium JHOS43]MCX7563524.1 histone deacetylase family protein [Xanthomonadaceae bacterium XH05]